MRDRYADMMGLCEEMVCDNKGYRVTFERRCYHKAKWLVKWVDVETEATGEKKVCTRHRNAMIDSGRFIISYEELKDNKEGE